MRHDFNQRTPAAGDLLNRNDHRFVIEVRPGDHGSVVAMRSKSRDGKGDIGANAKRIEALFAQLR